MGQKTAIVFGANGVSGTATITQLAKCKDWLKVISVSRRPAQLDFDDPRVIHISIDILQNTIPEIAKRLSDAGAIDATHVFHYTYIEKETPEEQTRVNVELLKKTLEAVVNTCPRLEAFVLQTGMKYYSVHLGPPKMAPMPFKEDAERREDLSQNFYYEQEDMLKEYAEKNKWRWVVTRPNLIVGLAKGNYMNVAITLGLYAALQKELGQPFRYPGNAKSWNAIVDHSTALNNAEFQIWAATTPAVGNNAYNIANGDKVRIKDLWPKLADYFGLKVSEEGMPSGDNEHMSRAFSFADYMDQHKDKWHEIAKKHGLDTTAYDYGTWQFVDFTFARTWGDEGSLDKARSKGWDKSVDTAQGYYQVFDKMKELKMIPK